MLIDFSKLTAMAAATMLVAGCMSDGSDSMVSSVSNWGEANRQTMAAQVIDPTPVYDSAVPQSSGEAAAKAVERYRTDKVKKPERIKTSTAGASAAGGN